MGTTKQHMQASVQKKTGTNLGHGIKQRFTNPVPAKIRQRPEGTNKKKEKVRERDIETPGRNKKKRKILPIRHQRKLRCRAASPLLKRD